MGTRESLDVVFRCPGCGFQGTYNQVSGHRLGASRSHPECNYPPQMVKAETGEITEQVPEQYPVESEEEENYDEEEEEPDEGTTTRGRSQARLAGDRSPIGPPGAPTSGPVGVPSFGPANIQPSAVKMTIQIPAILMALYDWCRLESGYMSSFGDFMIEAALGYWTEEVRCPACDTPILGFEIAVVPISELSEERR